MAQTLANGVVIPEPGDRISAQGVAEMRTLGASVNTGLALTQAQTAQTDLQSRARDADLADQVAGMEGMTYVGAWESGASYRINDVVTHGGDSWARLTAGDAGEPGASPTDWGLVARKGDGGGFGELSETDVTGLYATVEPEPSVPVSWADLTGKPATYPPATHTHPIADVPGLQAIIDRLTYDSGWRALCRWSGGVVTEGELPAGLAPRGTASGGVFIRRYPATVSVAVVEANVTAINPRINLPSGFRGSTGVPYPAAPIYYRDANLNAKIANAEFGSGFVRYRDVPAGATLSAAGTGGYGVMTTVPSEDSLPSSLPGTPA